MASHHSSDIHLHSTGSRMRSHSGSSTASMPRENVQPELRIQAIRLCRRYVQDWYRVAEHDIKCDVVRGGLTNVLVRCVLSDFVNGIAIRSVLVRIFGTAGEVFFERGLDSVNFSILAERGFGPKLLGVFDLGRIEEFIDGRTLCTEDIWDPAISVAVAERMAVLHRLTMPLDKRPHLGRDIQRWMTAAKGSPDTALVTDILDPVYEMEFVRNALHTLTCPVVFCHNDFQEGNIILIASETKEINLCVIDYEYGRYNYSAFDIANHFCEWSFNYAVAEGPGFTFKPEDFPKLEQQQRFARAYLHQYNDQREPTDDEIATLLRDVELLCMMSHLFWGLWSVIQVSRSVIVFGYGEYASVRLQEYLRRRKAWELNHGK